MSSVTQSSRGAPPQSSRVGGRSVKQSSRRVPESRSDKLANSKASKAARSAAGKIPEGPAPVIIRDEFGNDVTPKSLLPTAQASGAKAPGGTQESGSDAQSSAFDSAFGKGGAVGTSSVGSDGDVGGLKTPDLSEAEASDSEAVAEEVTSSKPKAAPAAEEPKAAAKLTEEDLDEMVTFELTETETFFLMDMAGTCVAADAPDAAAVQAANAAYDELLGKRTSMADMYVERSAQTFNLDKKPKEMQTMAVKTTDMASQATDWDLYDVLVAGAVPVAKEDAIEIEAASGGGGGGGGKGGSAALISGEGSSFAASGTEVSSLEMSSSGLAGVAALEGGEEGGGAASSKATEVSLRSLHALPGVLRIVERMVSQNIYQAKHLQYRHIGQKAMAASEPPPGEASFASSPAATFLPLWSFASEAHSAGRNVSCLEWNHGNQDLLAAGYGEFDFSKQQDDGLILFWSLKNPDSPDKAIRTPSGVTAVAFSVQHPNLLAAGLYDGTVCIFDVRKNDSKPMLESGHGSGGKHTDPVWQLCWVDQGGERGEMLVSISSDGRVTKWDMKKGLENQDLMKLKRVAAPPKQASSDTKQPTGGSEGIISRRASGMCIAFSPRDPNYYLAGTEDGHIHKCSCSYNEQHLESFFGHAGPVYKLRWSPFCPNTFISCSADWSIKLWHQESPNAIFTFFSTTDYVADVAWSPNNSTVFASVTGDGRIDVWDISANTLDPLASIQTGKRLSTVSFSEASPVLVVGHEGGGVDVFSLEGTLAEPTGRTTAEQIAALDKVTSTVQDH